MNRIRKIASWMIIVVLCLSFVAVCPKAEEEPTETATDVLENLLEVLEQNPYEGRYLVDEKQIDEYCLMLYGYIGEDDVQRVFYGGPEEAAALLRQLSSILNGNDTHSDVSLTQGEVYYVYVWTIIHDESLSQYKSRPYIKQTMSELFEGLSEDDNSLAIDVCLSYIEQYEPELILAGYYMETSSIDIHGDEAYIQYYRLGVWLFDSGRYTEAIEAYKKCLEYQQNDPNACFEIAEAYIALRNWDEAQNWLTRIAPCLEKKTDIARWLRRNGFIKIEEGDFETAYALYVYSLEFEQSTMAKNELYYIKDIAPSTKTFTAAEAAAYLQKQGIHFER